MRSILEKNKINDTKHWYIAWLTNKVILGIWETGKDNGDLDLTRIIQIRIFNATEELFIWKHGDEFKARHISDPWDQELVFCQKPFMWGTEIKDSKLHEPNRGLEISLGAGLPSGLNLPLRYQVENLFNYDEKNGSLIFTDARLTAILDCHGKIVAPEVENA